jgi:predicted Zn-dependent protease
VINVLKNQERFAADLAKAQGRPVPEQNNWLASHPSNDDRLAQITRLSAQYKDTGKYLDEGRARYLQMIDGMAFGESAEQGLTRGRNFYHSGLGIVITAAQGWSIQNQPDQIAVINATRDAGLTIHMVPPNAGKTHDEIIRNVIKPSAGRVEPRQINGMPATHFVGVQTAQNGQKNNIELTVVTGPNNTPYILVYEAKDAATLQRNIAQLRENENGFRPMSQNDAAQARPWLVRTTPMPRGGFAELARATPIANPEQQLKLINGVYAGGTIPPGTPVKVVVQ